MYIVLCLRNSWERKTDFATFIYNSILGDAFLTTVTVIVKCIVYERLYRRKKNGFVNINGDGYWKEIVCDTVFLSFIVCNLLFRYEGFIFVIIMIIIIKSSSSLSSVLSQLLGYYFFLLFLFFVVDIAIIFILMLSLLPMKQQQNNNKNDDDNKM